ncbi:MAG: VWA domain-containing protein [Ardenticatenales bacterium]
MRLPATGHRARFAAALAAAAALLTVATGGFRRADVVPTDVRAQGTSLREAYRLADTWTGEGVGAPGSLLDPGGIDIGDGRVWVVDRGNGRIQSFMPDGAFVSAWGQRGAGDEDFVAPRDVAVGDRLVYVTDPGKDAVLVFDLDGAPVAQWRPADFSAPWGIAASGGRVAVSLPDAGEVRIFDLGGAETARWTGLSQPHGLWFTPDGRLVVAQTGLDAVTVHDTTGREVARVTSPRPPMDAAMDERGDLYVQAADVIYWFESGKPQPTSALYYDDLQALAVSSRYGVYASAARLSTQFHGIVRFPWRPRDGAAATSWRLTGYPLGRLNQPAAITAAADGRIWVADAWPRVQVFTPEGRAVDQRELAQPATDIGVEADDWLVVAELGRLHRFDASGKLDATLQLGPTGRRWWVTGLTIQPDGRRLTLADGAYGWARDVGLTTTLLPAGGFPMVPPGQPWELYWDIASYAPSGGPVRLYAVDRSAHAVDVFEGGARISRIAIDGIPTRIAIDTAGLLYVLTTEGLVWKLETDGTPIAAWDAGAFSASGIDITDLTVDGGGRVYTLDRAGNTVRVWEVDPDAPAEPPLARGGACRVRGDKRAAPESLRLGGQVTVELLVGGECPNTLPRADIVLAIDRSFSMTENNGITATRQAATAFLDALDLSEDRVGVVSFNNTASLVQPLTDDPTAAKAAIAAVVPIGGTDIARAIDVAAAELFGIRHRSNAKPILILLTDGRPSRGPDDTLQAAASARQRGAQIFTIGFGDVDPMVMALTASTPEDAYIVASTDTLMAVYTEIANRLTADVLAKEVHITDELPVDMAYIGSTDGPAPRVNGQTLSWDLTDVPFGGVRLAYTVEPKARGRRPTNVQASATFVDGLARPGTLRFPVPEVSVLDLEPTPTATFTPKPTVTPQPTPTSIPVPVYLPVTLRQSCSSADIGTDVIIVMDNSGSMAEPVRAGGPTRLQAAVAAAAVLVDRMRATDRAAIVAFNREAELVQELTGDAALLRAQLNGLQTAAGTRLDLGLAVAYDELVGPRAVAGNTRAVVLLTDGVSEIEDQVVLDQAARVKPEVARLFVIGLGNAADLNFGLLRAVASNPSDFFEAPDPDQLTVIYSEVARTITCANLDWPGRQP